MKNELLTKNYEGQEVEVKTLGSKEIAEMVGIKHWEILRKLEGTEKTKGIIPILTDNKIVVSDYFIKSSYKDESGKENKCYLVTKMGCEFLANKFTGEKGILFTAKYVKIFNEMEQKLTHKDILALRVFQGGSAGIMAHKELVQIEVGEETAKIKDGNNKILTCGQIVKRIDIKYLTTTILHEWMCINGFGHMIKKEGQKKRCFQPSQKFFDYVAKKGYGYTGTTQKGDKTKVIYSTNMVNMLVDNHFDSIKEYVQIKTGRKVA